MSPADTSPREPTENSPLLSDSHETNHPPNQPPQRKAWQTPENLILIFLAAIILTSLGDQWQESPQTRTAEAIICYRYYEKVDPSKIRLGRHRVGPGAIGGVKEMYCKVDEVQSELAALRGWQQLFDLAPGLLLSVPFGWAADKYGRKPVLLAGILGTILHASWIQLVTWFWQSFDIRMVWLSTLFAAIGGGPSVLSTMAFVVLSDISPEAKRAAIFLRVAAFNQISFMLMPPFAAILMETSPWIPNLGGTVLNILAGLVLAFSPETQNYNHPSLGSTCQPPPSQLSTTDAENLEQSDVSQRSIALQSITRWTTALKKSTAFLTDDWRVPLLILPFLEHYLRATLGQLILQYVSKRYGMKLSKAILLSTIRWGVIVVLLFSILPYISTAMIRYFRLSAQRKDLYLARLSMVILSVGWMLVGASPNVPTLAISLSISSLGWGASLLLRSFLASLVPKQNIARVYSIISVVDTIGAMIGAPLMAGLFKRGLALGGFGIGLPFYFLGLVSACFSILLFAIGLRKGEEDYIPVPEDEAPEDQEDA